MNYEYKNNNNYIKKQTNISTRRICKIAWRFFCLGQ